MAFSENLNFMSLKLSAPRILQDLHPDKPDGFGNLQEFSCNLLLWQKFNQKSLRITNISVSTSICCILCLADFKLSNQNYVIGTDGRAACSWLWLRKNIHILFYVFSKFLDFQSWQTVLLFSSRLNFVTRAI